MDNLWYYWSIVMTVAFLIFFFWAIYQWSQFFCRVRSGEIFDYAGKRFRIQQVLDNGSDADSFCDEGGDDV